MDQSSDEELMSRLATDDSAALEAIMKRYERTVLNTIYRFLGDAQWAEEVAQDVFVSIYQQRHRYQSRGRFSTWLFRIVKNRCLNELRDRARANPHPLEFRQDVERVGDVCQKTQPDRETAQAEVEEALNAALQSLPESQRMAFILSQIDGFSYMEVAETLGVSLSACESLIHRARLNLRDKLRPLLRA